jgi:hypothetical protein
MFLTRIVKNNKAGMPQNDLIGFRRLEPEGTVNNGTRRAANSWAEAVDLLWKMPLPRVIQVTGGHTFELFGGAGLSVTLAPVGDGDVSRNLFRFAGDKEQPAVDAGQRWVEASPTANYADQRFDCLLVSGLATYGGIRHNGVGWINEPLVFAQPGGTGLRVTDAWNVPNLDSHVFRWRVTERSNETAAQQVPSGGSGRIDGSGTVAVEGPGAAAWRLYRLTGDTQLTEGGAQSGWNYMAYGWMVQNAADSQFLTLKIEFDLSRPADTVLPGRMRYVGCYRDHGGDRANEANLTQIPVQGNQHVNWLGRHAALLGKRLFSVQAGNQLWVSDADDLGRVTRHGPAERQGGESCQQTDGGRNNAGGAYAMAVYENTPEFIQFQQGLIPTQFGLVTHLGCWRDRSDRIMSHRLQDLGGNRNTVLERAIFMVWPQGLSLRRWQTHGHFLVGIESGNQVFYPSEYEYNNWSHWQRHGRLSGCDIYDALGRPLGSDWGMSVYMVNLADTYNRISTVTAPMVASW